MATPSSPSCVVAPALARISLDSRPKASNTDWSLPPAFINYLDKDPKQVIDELIPLPNDFQPTSSTGKTTAALPAFLQSMTRTGDTRTAKGAVAHESAQSPLVDLFFDFSPGVDSSHLWDLLEKAWNDDALITLKIVFHARSIHEGKGFKEGFFRAMGWVWDKHPRTLLENLHLLVEPTCQRPRDTKKDAAVQQKRNKAILKADNGVVAVDDLDEHDDLPEYPARPHGSFDDLVDLLILHINDQLSSSYQGGFSSIDEALAPAFPAKHFKRARMNTKPGSKRDRSGFKHILKAARGDDISPFTRKLWQAPSATAKLALLQTRAKTALSTDKKFIALYLTILHLFFDHLKADLSALEKHNDFIALPEANRKPYKGDQSPHLFDISFAAKWVPTPAHAVDKQVLFATALALKLYPGDSVSRSRSKLQKEVLSPLRKVLAVPEVAMSDGTWKINYTTVPAKSMARNAEHFIKHDPQGFDNYLVKVSKGELTIAAASLQPHEILMDTTSSTGVFKTRLADLQWSSLVTSLRNSSDTALENCLAIADVSGSMGSYNLPSDKRRPSPIFPCIALTLLLGELASPPWNGAFFTFSTDPKCNFIDTTLPLSERAASLSRSQWEMSTNFYKVFDLILDNALRDKLEPQQMIKKLFVFSDMQFDQASNGQFGATEHQTIEAKFAKAGYPMPEMVYWNLSGSAGGTPKPVTSDIRGVSLFSGFSGALMKYFLRGQDAMAVEDGDEADEGFIEIEKEEQESGATATIHSSREKAVMDPVRVKKNPLEAVLSVVSAECFDGLKVVD